MSDNPLSQNFIRAIPKTDLHVHLDGSLRLTTLIELARERDVELPSYTEDGLRQLVFKESYANLGEYLQGFAYTCAALQDAEALERAAYELAQDSFAEGVRYLEPRFAPQLHIHRQLDLPAVLQAIDRGLKRARDQFNARPAIAAGQEPPADYGIIACALRMFDTGFSNYYDRVLDVHSYSPKRDARAMASLELARAIVQMRDEHGLPIVGFDLAGQEDGHPAHVHVNAYRHAHRHFLHKTVHAGEAYGPESIFEAITLLHADRIGHGYYLFDTEKISNPNIENPDAYVRALVDYIADRRITLEICLTSNLQTNPALESLAQHPWRRMVDERISTTFCTDNRLVSNTTVTREITLAAQHLDLTPYELRNCVIYGFKRSFMRLPYIKKRDYVRHIIDYYDAVERQHGVTSPHPPGHQPAGLD